MVRTDHLRQFFLAMYAPRTFYVLGAGASAGLAPMVREWTQVIMPMHDLIGIYPVTSQPSDLRQYFSVREISAKGIRGQLFWNCPAGRLDLLVQRALSPELTSTIPPNYLVLSWANPVSTFFNFNLDGLASHYLSPSHLVLEPHGRVDRLWTWHEDVPELLEESGDDRFRDFNFKWLIGKEPAWMTSRRPYRLASERLHRATSVVSIGYSFNRDDSESLSFFAEHIPPRCPMLVVAPDARDIAGRLNQEMKSNRAIPINLYWDRLCVALMECASDCEDLGAIAQSEERLDLVSRRYAELSDRDPNYVRQRVLGPPLSEEQRSRYRAQALRREIAALSYRRAQG